MSNNVTLKTVSCRNCGAELVFDPGTQTTTCNFCSSRFEVGAATDTEVFVPDGVIPFKVTKEEYRKSLLTWLSQGDYTPDDILNASIFDEINGIYLPMYFFSGKYEGNWSASSGYDRTEEYSVRDTNGALIRKTRTVTDWRPSNGQVAGTFAVLSFAGNGKGIKPEIAAYAHETAFERGDLKPFNSQYTLGFNLLNFATDQNDAWSRIGKGQADAITHADVRSRVPGDRSRDLAFDISYEHERILKIYVPYWIVYYKYCQKEYHVCMDGINSRRVAGKRPEDQSRKNQVAKYFLPSHSVLVVWLLIWFLMLGNSMSEATLTFWIGLATTIAFYSVSCTKKMQLLNESKRRREAILQSHLVGA